MGEMKHVLFITGTDTGVGKTVLSSLLTRFLLEKGHQVAAFKPLCSGGRDDARELHSALANHFTLDIVNPWFFRAAIAPLLAARLEKKPVHLRDVLSHIRSHGKNHDFVLVEGAGGLLSPLGEDFNSRDLLTRLRATPIIVAPNKLGVVNHLLLTLAALPPTFRRRARRDLMAPAQADSATTSNETLLRLTLPRPTIAHLPWLGTPFDSAKAVKIPTVRRALATLI